MTNEIAKVPDNESWQIMKEQIKHAISSGLLPSSIKTPQQAFVIIQKGREIGIPMMQALSQINVISGKPTMSAELMLGQIYRNVPGAYIHFKTLSNDKCEIECARSKDMPYTKIAFSIEDAKKAGVMRNPVWSKYPRAMLRSRAISEMARTIFPDAICGISYTPEELGGPVTPNEEIDVSEAHQGE